MIQDPVRTAESRALRPTDESALDIADYLREEADDEADIHRAEPAGHGTTALVIGALGVVYGDIGTSPIYAFREALRAAGGGAAVAGVPEVLGVLSLLIWSLILIVTVKYVIFLLRADNRGEGGILALYTLVRLAAGRRSLPVLLLAVAGAALFAGDAIITPAISVLSAVEGAELILPGAAELVLPVTLGILVALFVMQSYGTARIAGVFGPVTAVWFVMLAGLGLWHLMANPAVLQAFDPRWGMGFLIHHPGLSFAVLGAVFLAVTGGEALYADLGHFGRKPIAIAWVALVFPALVLNYLGQGALVLTNPAALNNPFFSLAGPTLLPFLVVLATAATVIASQAVISGAFSMARAAMQLGFLPRLTIRHTAQNQSGQIYIEAVNWLLLFGVVWLVLAFRSSAALASAYGIAVTGTMVLTTILGTLYLIRGRGVPLPVAVVAVLPILMIELCFLSSNLVKLREGGYVPVTIAAILVVIMWAWWRGSQRVLARAHKQSIALPTFVKAMRETSALSIPGTAFFLTPDPEIVPSALLHNLKHNRVLHDQTVFLTVETLRVPYATADERASVDMLGGRFARLTLRFGYMETPNISRALGHARKAGLKFDVMTTTFFLGRRRPVASGSVGLARAMDRIYLMLSRFSADPSDYYHLPRDRVVELGERVPI